MNEQTDAQMSEQTDVQMREQTDVQIGEQLMCKTNTDNRYSDRFA